jgi:hypothetical protein
MVYGDKGGNAAADGATILAVTIANADEQSPLSCLQ